jgi:hypothetical protein
MFKKFFGGGGEEEGKKEEGKKEEEKMEVDLRAGGDNQQLQDESSEAMVEDIQVTVGGTATLFCQSKHPS